MAHHDPTLRMLLLLLLVQMSQLVAVGSLLPPAAAAPTHTEHLTGAVPLPQAAAEAAAVVPCRPDQEWALLRLKRSFSITDKFMAAFRSWRAGTDCCRWDGVSCGYADGRVTSLDLGGRHLVSGGLDPSLFRLTSLEYLSLASNDFNVSELPSTGFERLTNLTHLNLRSTNIAGNVPAGIGSLTNLVSLDLSADFKIYTLTDDNYVLYLNSSRNPHQLIESNFENLVANLRNLRELNLGLLLDLSDNGDRWCKALVNSCPKLQVLGLSYCLLSGPICGELSHLHSLSVIDLSFNHLSGPIPDFSNIPNLTVLQLRCNWLEGWVSPLIFQHKNLVTIDLYHNLEIHGNLPIFSTGSHLETVSVSETKFNGTIPDSIGNLKSLKELGLGASGFSGNLPPSIGNLRSLNSLEISGLGLSGSMPSWVANLSSLTTLQFTDCGLSGSIPSFLGDMRNLTKLVLSNCNFSGTIPSHIFNLTQLQILLLHSNNFIGTVELTSMWILPDLFILDLSDNKLVVVDGTDNSSIVSIPKLRVLRLSRCNISKFPNFLRHQDEIISLDLSHNQIDGAIPQWAWETWNEMERLFLGNNKFTSVGHDPFLPMSHIDGLDLSFNMFEGPIPIPQGYANMLDYSNNRFSSIPFNFTTHLKDVSFFKAARNNFSGKIPQSFCSATSLQLIDLSYNSFDGTIPSCLMDNLQYLEVLNLKENELQGEFPNNINENCSFESLIFSGNRIEGQLPRSLAFCKYLEVLDVGNNQINDSFPCWMSTLNALQVLVLKSNKFFGQVAQHFAEEKSTCEFQSARIVDLASNRFSGTLPQEWFKKLKAMMIEDSNVTLVMEFDITRLGKYDYTVALTYKGSEIIFTKILRTLVFIDLSDNAFHGSIPEAIGELVLLNVLNISHNSLTGPIPSQLGRLAQLESLDISSNELSGEIPQQLASLDFLTVLNLSYNKLEGEIPESPHFLTFSNSSFLGNDGLCGRPLSKGCINITSLNVIPSKKNSLDVLLFLFAGLGFGFGFALSIVVIWGIPIRKRSRVR
uniref:non-specific serine/threonine protein kinase n=1 Tax=Oryza nivara TaxID=4536 RepID=A0A0E0FGI7_ORYNI